MYFLSLSHQREVVNRMRVRGANIPQKPHSEPVCGVMHFVINSHGTSDTLKVKHFILVSQTKQGLGNTLQVQPHDCEIDVAL